MRSTVRLTFNAPSDQELDRIQAAFERIQGRRASTRQINYLIRLFRVHGPLTVRLLETVFCERGSTENLLLYVECHAPARSVEDPGDRSSEDDPIAIA
jgi:hypothetical protein